MSEVAFTTNCDRPATPVAGGTLAERMAALVEQRDCARGSRLPLAGLHASRGRGAVVGRRVGRTGGVPCAWEGPPAAPRSLCTPFCRCAPQSCSGLKHCARWGASERVHLLLLLLLLLRLLWAAGACGCGRGSARCCPGRCPRWRRALPWAPRRRTSWLRDRRRAAPPRAREWRGKGEGSRGTPRVASAEGSTPPRALL